MIEDFLPVWGVEGLKVARDEGVVGIWGSGDRVEVLRVWGVEYRV